MTSSNKYTRQDVIDAFTAGGKHVATEGKIYPRSDDLSEFMKQLDVRIQSNPVDVCEWKYEDHGMFGCRDVVYKTTCGKTHDADTTDRTKYCPNCGKLTK